MNQTQKAIKKQIKSTNRTREVGINIRVTPEEKAKIRGIAYACKISVSELIRQLVAGQQIRTIPPEVFYETKDALTDIKISLTRDEITPQETLDAVRSCILEFETIVRDFYLDEDGSFGKQYCDQVHRKWESQCARFGD